MSTFDEPNGTWQSYTTTCPCPLQVPGSFALWVWKASSQAWELADMSRSYDCNFFCGGCYNAWGKLVKGGLSRYSLTNECEALARAAGVKIRTWGNKYKGPFLCCSRYFTKKSLDQHLRTAHGGPHKVGAGTAQSGISKDAGAVWEFEVEVQGQQDWQAIPNAAQQDGTNNLRRSGCFAGHSSLCRSLKYITVRHSACRFS